MLTVYNWCAGFPTSPRVASRTLQAKERRARRSSRTKFILGLGIAAGLVALCMLSSYFLPMLSSSHPASPMSSVSPIGLWASSPPRRLLDYSEVGPATLTCCSQNHRPRSLETAPASLQLLQPFDSTMLRQKFNRWGSLTRGA